MTLLTQKNNIWTYARNEVEKPDALTQLKHSSTYRKTKKILTTKAGALGAVRDVAQKATALIPLPAVGGIVSALLGNVHSAARSARLQKRLKQATEGGDVEKQMKFLMKTLDTTTLREHQKKTTEAYKAMVEGIEGHAAHMKHAVEHHAVCPEMLKRAKQIQYTLKQVTRLEEEAADLMECARLLAEYSRQLKETTEQYRDRFSKLWAENVPKTLDASQGEYEDNPYHANCLDNGYCVIVKRAGGTKQMPAQLKQALKIVLSSGASGGVGYGEFEASKGIKGTYVK